MNSREQKRLKKNNRALEICDAISHTVLTFVLLECQREVRENGAKKNLRHNDQKLLKFDKNHKIIYTKAHQIPRRINTKKITLRNIVIKFLEMNSKEKIWKAERENNIL